MAEQASSSKVNQKWIQIEGTDIEYEPWTCYKIGSKIFDARRKSGGKDQETVVKFVTDFNIEDEKFMKKIQREIDNHWTTHTHKNVVTYFDSGYCKFEGQKAIFILMEKCDINTLYERIEKENLPYIERAKTIKCIALGLQYLKNNNIVHRNLNPQNILYKGDVGVISDFGLSKTVSPDKSHTHQSFQFVGTAGWGAPETYSDNAKSTFAADIYSAGLVFHFVLTNGMHPYGDCPLFWQTYIIKDEYADLKPLHDTPNGEVAYDLISLMLSRDPKDRPSIEEVLKHPFFWDVKEKKQFYDYIYSTIEYHKEKKMESRIFSSQVAKYLNEVETEKKDWKNKLPFTDAEKKTMKDNFGRQEFEITIQEDLMKGFAKKLPDSVTSMVCFVRNRFAHNCKNKRDKKIDLTNEELWEFFNSRYPYLFIYTYYASKDYYETKTASDPPELQTPLKMTAKQASSQRERLEDVFQDEIIMLFADIASFKKFAQSENGLYLDQADMQTIVEDLGGNVKTQMLEMCFKWREIQGEKATVREIRHLLHNYFREDNPSDYIVLENGLFGFYKTRFLRKRSKVYLGVQISEIAGTLTRAIKFVPKNENNLREAQILVTLGNHVNVVSIIHAGILHANPHNHIYTAMEHSWTLTVRNLLEECIIMQKSLQQFIAWSLVEQLMRAVEFLHSHNIIHRDVKPDNVLASDDLRNFKLTDFDLSEEIQDDSATIQNIEYRSSKAYNPEAKITVKVDIFSAGVTIGEIMANGKHPFGEDPDLRRYNIRKNKNLDLSHLCVFNKDQVISLIKPMLEMDPEKRPTATEVLNDVSICFQMFQRMDFQETTADESLPTTSKSITEQSITEKVNQEWKQIKGHNIEYDHASRYRKETKVFNAIRKSGGKDQEAVVKFVTGFNIEDEKKMKKIQREINNHLATHTHKNVVKYFDSGYCKYEGEDALFILMEKCDKKTLYERIKEENLPYIERAKTVKCIARGLQYLRKNNILHRDLKPQNILYKDNVYVIADFGLSKTISNKSQTPQSLKFVGTVGWSAPETYLNNAKSSFAADIYSAGLVFHFTLTKGKHPYGDNPIFWETHLIKDENCNLKALHDTPNGKVAYDLISLMLSREHKDRPTIEEVLKHPFFWDVEKKKNFYDDIWSTIEYHSEKKTESRIFSSQPAKYWDEIETERKDWKGKLPSTIADDAKKLSDSVTNMVCFIRNRFAHNGEDKRDKKIDLTNEELWEFFDSRYTYLFIYTYYASKDYCETKPASDPGNLKKYF